jgi:hypothetical protein
MSSTIEVLAKALKCLKNIKETDLNFFGGNINGKREI